MGVGKGGGERGVGRDCKQSSGCGSNSQSCIFADSQQFFGYSVPLFDLSDNDISGTWQSVAAGYVTDYVWLLWSDLLRSGRRDFFLRACFVGNHHVGNLITLFNFPYQVVKTVTIATGDSIPLVDMPQHVKHDWMSRSIDEKTETSKLLAVINNR